MMQKVRSRACLRVALELLVDMWFQVLLIPLTGVLFTFPSRYLFTIGRKVVFSLTRWSWQIHTGLHVSRITWGTHSASQVFAYAAITLYGPSFQTVPLTFLVLPWPRNPPITFVIEVWAIFSGFARHYYRNHSLFSFPQGTEMFHFPWFACSTLCIQVSIQRR